MGVGVSGGSRGVAEEQEDRGKGGEDTHNILSTSSSTHRAAHHHLICDSVLPGRQEELR